MALRSPDNLTSSVWVDAASVHGDKSLTGLPVGGCDPHGEVTVGGVPVASTTVAADTSTTSTPSTTTVAASTTTSKVGTPATNAPATPAPATTAAPTPTTPSDTSGPLISGTAASPNPIYEDVTACGGAKPRVATVTTSVTDASGVGSVTMSWTVNGTPFADKSGQTSKTMTRDNTPNSWSAQLGAFPDVAEPGVTVVVTITARDGRNNVSTTSVNVSLKSCFFG